MALTAGARLKATAGDTQVVVVKAGADGDLTCGGAPMVALDDDATTAADVDPSFADGTLMGKRYTNADGSIELLCTKPGAGSLALDGTALEIKSAKPLPASD